MNPDRYRESIAKQRKRRGGISIAKKRQRWGGISIVNQSRKEQ